MTSNQLIESLARQPFERLEIHLTDGKTIGVESPWRVATAPSRPTFAYYGAGDEMRILSLRNVTQIVTVDRKDVADAN